jgi:hypothetical protein
LDAARLHAVSLDKLAANALKLQQGWELVDALLQHAGISAWVRMQTRRRGKLVIEVRACDPGPLPCSAEQLQALEDLCDYKLPQVCEAAWELLAASATVASSQDDGHRQQMARAPGMLGFVLIMQFKQVKGGVAAMGAKASGEGAERQLGPVLPMAQQKGLGFRV